MSRLYEIRACLNEQFLINLLLVAVLSNVLHIASQEKTHAEESPVCASALQKTMEDRLRAAGFQQNCVTPWLDLESRARIVRFLPAFNLLEFQLGFVDAASPALSLRSTTATCLVFFKSEAYIKLSFLAKHWLKCWSYRASFVREAHIGIWELGKLFSHGRILGRCQNGQCRI